MFTENTNVVAGRVDRLYKKNAGSIWRESVRENLAADETAGLCMGIFSGVLKKACIIPAGMDSYDKNRVSIRMNITVSFRPS